MTPFAALPSLLPLDEAAAVARWADRGWVPSAVLLAAILGCGWLARRLFVSRLERLAARTATRVDDLAIEVTRRYSLPGALFVALAAAARVAPIEPDLRQWGARVFVSGFLAVLVFAAARFTEGWFARRGGTAEGRPSLLQTSVRLAVIVAGLLFVLGNLGVEIAPLLTALGVGSLAIGLALQPTLSNFFAGMHLSMSKPIRVGDFIELEDGSQGHVVDIAWRATRVRQLANNLLVIPNSRLAEMRLINYSLPDEAQAVLVPVGVAYDSDLDRVERVTLEVAREIQRSLPEADPEHEPFLRYDRFDDSAIVFNVILRARAFTQRWPLIHEFVKALHARFRAEGIEIPFPQRVVTLLREGTARRPAEPVSADREDEPKTGPGDRRKE